MEHTTQNNHSYIMPTRTFTSLYELLGIKANKFAEMLGEGKEGEREESPAPYLPPSLTPSIRKHIPK